MFNIEEIKRILLSYEQKLKSNKEESIFANKKNILPSKTDINATVKQLSNFSLSSTFKSLEEQLDEQYIRSLASGNNTRNIDDFRSIADSLISVDSEFIDYLVARNPFTSEGTRFKIALKPNEPTEILVELARTTKSSKLLEYLFETESTKLKIAVLNNPALSKSSKCEEFYLSSFSSFTGSELMKLKPEYIPVNLKDAYKGQKYIQYLKYDIREVCDIVEHYMPRRYSEDLFDKACEEQAPARLRYQMLVNSSLRK